MFHENILKNSGGNSLVNIGKVKLMLSATDYPLLKKQALKAKISFGSIWK
jgi:hypothetical protein